MKEVIAKSLQKSIKKEGITLNQKEIENLMETPPSISLGDFSFPCFFLASKLKKNPNEIASILEKDLGKQKEFEVKTAGPYINFTIDKKKIALDLIKEVLSKKGKYGMVAGKKISMVEFPSPNTNKPLHLGHLRNMAIGEGVSRILEFGGEKVIRTSLNNDRGTHICKSMLAYELHGKNKQPDKKSDHFVGDFYVLFNQKKIPEEKAQEMLQKWEKGDKETIALWKKMNKWALDGFKETYKKYGIKLDKEYFESKIYTEGKEVIEKGLKKRVFEKRKDGSVIIDLNKEKLGEKVVLRSDGTSVYITQDIHLAKLKFDEYKLDKSIYVVGNEQEYHFKVLFEIMERLGLVKKEKLNHLSYGMVNLPEGKMKSREGTVVDADDFIQNVQDLVKKELTSRAKLSEKELESRSLKIALSSIKYLLLKTDTRKNMLFDPKESVRFEGDTGPYIQYTYARASSILRKSNSKKKLEDFELEEKEIELIKKLSQFKEVLSRAHKTLNPSLIAHYAYQLAQIFNEFYHSCPVIDSKNEAFRLKLIEAFRQILKNSLYILGIDVLEEM